MLLSPDQNKDTSKNCHQESGMVNKWWVIDCSVLKTLSTLFLIHRWCSAINIKLWLSNINLQSVKTVLSLTNWYSSVLSGACPNNALQLTSQYAVSLRYTLYCRSTELRRYIAKQEYG